MSSNTFTLGANNKGNNPKRPDYRGEAIIDGKKYNLSGWIRTVKEGPRAGKKFLSGTVQLDEQRAPAKQEASSAPLNTDPDF